MKSVAVLFVAVTSLWLCGCADRAFLISGQMPPPQYVSKPSSTPAVRVSMPDETESLEWVDYEGPDDPDYTLNTYWSSGKLKSSHQVWGRRVKAWSTYDRRGRLRSASADMLTRIADLSRIRPADFARHTWSSTIRGVYMVGNRWVTDADVLQLYRDSRIQWMIVERCWRITPATMREIKPKLVDEFPEDW